MSLSLDLAPSYYPSAQTANWVVSEDVAYFNFTRNGPPPVISEYIAYDQLVPPNPFLAVTQDGRGNVVYDGGFPKFYNTSAPAAGSDFSQLNASAKFLYNAINWCANPEKVAANDKRILILGDKNSGEPYSVKDTLAVRTDGFRTTFDRICAAAGYTPTYLTRSDFGSNLDVRLATLENYAVVLLMSSVWSTAGNITDQCVTDLQSYRELGGGLIVITDHGQVVPNLASAWPLSVASGFATANKLIRNFGAYFSGDYNRSPVNVGFLRQTYGDHPLYDGMLNSESIYAGGSESRVVVAEYERFTADNAPPVSLNQPGINTVQAIAVMNDGTIETHRFVYVIAGDDLIAVSDADGQPVDEIDTGYGPYLPTLDLGLNVSGLGTVRGVIRRGNVQIGEFSYEDGAGQEVEWYGGSSESHLFNDGEVLSFNITLPFPYQKNVTLKRFQPVVEFKFSLADFIRDIGEYANDKPEETIETWLARISGTGIPLDTAFTESMADNVERVKAFFKRV